MNTTSTAYFLLMFISTDINICFYDKQVVSVNIALN